ncbi:MAG: permease-like cell division protein FtsX [Bacteroidetes bacterium]|nr:permease-like cell division protein FtsX [Bacteroidota bacterium]
MFMLGLLGFSVLGFNGLSRSLIEGSGIDIYFKDSVSEQTVFKFENELKTKDWLKRSHFVSREEGLKQMGDKYDDDFMQYVEASELPLSLEVFFKAEKAQPANIATVAREIESFPFIEDVVYQKNLVESVNKNVNRIQWILLVLVILFTLIAIGLINSSTRLSIFANRFIIKSMQLVGATNSFIVRPFLLKFLKHALLAIPIAGFALAGILYGLHYVWKEFGTMREFAAFINWQYAVIVFTGIAIFGIILAIICAWFSTRKYLRSKIENLY